MVADILLRSANDVFCIGSPPHSPSVESNPQHSIL